MQSVCLIIKNSKLRQFGHSECTVEADWIERCITNDGNRWHSTQENLVKIKSFGLSMSGCIELKEINGNSWATGKLRFTWTMAFKTIIENRSDLVLRPNRLSERQIYISDQN